MLYTYAVNIIWGKEYKYAEYSNIEADILPIYLSVHSGIKLLLSLFID